MQVVVIGAGVVGLTLSCRLAQTGARVTVVDAGQSPGAGASASSFGWLNASFYNGPDHFALRRESLLAWRKAQADFDLPGIVWPGALWWEEQGAGFDKMHAALTALDYSVATYGREKLQQLVPALAQDVPNALCFADEGVVEPAILLPALAQVFRGLGGAIRFGTQVISTADDGVVTQFGKIAADKTIICAGTGAQDLMQSLGHPLPMLVRPGALLRSQPLPRLMSHVLVTEQGEFWQDAQGRVVTPGVVSHQADASEHLAQTPEDMAQAATARLAKVVTLPSPVAWSDISVAFRPVPQDGLPVIGPVTDKHYVAVMHSGMTLAAITAELATSEILGLRSNKVHLLAPFRPERFLG